MTSAATPASQIDSALRRCRVSALHLEMRDGYMLDDPDYYAWQTGHRLDPDDRTSWWRPWLQNIVDAVERGAVMRRARIVSEPISPYIHYEYDITFPNVRAGEQVRWLPRQRATDLLVPGNDFWLFDGETLLVNHFNGVGDWIDVEHVTDPDVIGKYTAAFEAIWERAVPHDDYQPTV
ncbi:hypothetical protein Ppa06_57190 [Planomonospora parontospora subsp. parontospora]|uniref:DUF6879 domain-containing protein n=2 Tax=Planomonospora parontospora TaxID=58119 RepID=A0AA37F7M0_9ACTN|nr:DUF6879 family protein [Planomonospora parontospora]GGK91042.1 hypothetical protein GCM10010126_58110 [Planomonospora parontospora]GII11921.1 hypothetical protein Ppa06_57190 [Planomonospora parontospora subsp. parontospora]